MDIVRTYSEVFEILNFLGDEYIKKIPTGLYNHIDNNRNVKSIVEYDINKNILEQNISEDARDMISYLNLQYWCTEEEKQELMKQYKKNDDIYEEKLREVYNVDIFANRKYKNTYQNEDTQLTEYKENILKKIFRKILKWIKNK